MVLHPASLKDTVPVSLAYVCIVTVSSARVFTCSPGLNDSYATTLPLRLTHQGANDHPHRAQAANGAPIVRPATGSYVPETYSVRLSIKLFNCTPENLPSDLRDQLMSWMSAMPAGTPANAALHCHS